MQNGTIFEKSQNIFLKRGGVMAYLSDDELLDTEGGSTVWDDKIGAVSVEETLEQALAEERLSLIHISEPTRLTWKSRMPSSA